MSQLIDRGDYFELTSENQVHAARKVIKLLKHGNDIDNVHDKGLIVNTLNKDIYDSRTAAKTLLKNLVRSKNHLVVSDGNRKLFIKGQISEKKEENLTLK